MFTIRLGVPEMEAFWTDLCSKVENRTASNQELKRYKQLGKAMSLLASDPRYPGLCSHEIKALTDRYGQKVWESYLENKTPAAGRIFWVYGPEKNDITIIGIEPHPDDKKNAFQKITLSAVSRREQ